MVIPDGVEKIGNHWFWGCDVEEVTVPASVKEIGTEAFCGCKKLAKVAFQEHCESKKAANNTVLSRLFKNLNKLTCFASPPDEKNQLRVIGNGAFRGCSSLKAIGLPDCVEEIGLEAFASSGLEELVFPKSVKTVGPFAFHDCRGLRSVRLNEGLEKLGEPQIVWGEELKGGVFAGSGLESIELPSTLKVVEM